MHCEAEAVEHTKKRDTGHQSVSLENKIGDSTMLKMGDSAKVVIKQDMKGRRHKYGFNNNEREKAQKKRVVDDEIADKHQLNKRDLFLGFSEHQERLRKKLALEEGRIFAANEQAEFDIPEASDSRTKRKLIRTVGERWRQFKSDLTRKWALAANQDGVEDTDVHIKAQAIQKQNIAPHVLSHGGYDYLEQKLLAEKTKKKLQEAA
ncbi:hypothetical protein HKD37_15G043501 [Glycine soja]